MFTGIRSRRAAIRPEPLLSATTRRVALIVSGAFFIEQLDSTIIATAIPDIARAFGVPALELNMTMTAYMLALAVFVPVSGRIADRFGNRAVFGLATGLFILSSLLCGAASSVEMLVSARFLQGIGGAMMAPVGRLIVLRTASKAEMVETMAWVLLPAMVAPMVGPALGGLITTYASWRWIFLINVPLGLVAMWMIFRHVEPDRRRGESKVSFDPLGAAWVAASFALATLGLEAWSRQGAGSVSGGIMLMAGCLCFAGYRRHSRRHPSPVLDLTLMRLPTFRWSLIGGSLFRVGVGGVPFLLPVTLQIAYGMSPLVSGLVVLMPALGGFAMKFFTTRLLQRFGYRQVMIINGLAAALFLGLFALVEPGCPWWIICLVLILFGLSRSLHMNAYGTLAYADVGKERMAAATSFFLSIQNLTVGLGVVVAAMAVSAAGSGLPQAADWVHFALAFAVLTGCCALSVIVSLLFDKQAGAELLSRRR